MGGALRSGHPEMVATGKSLTGCLNPEQQRDHLQCRLIVDAIPPVVFTGCLNLKIKIGPHPARTGVSHLLKLGFGA